MSVPATEAYVVHAKTAQSATSVATQDPADALKRAREMAELGDVVMITDLNGSTQTVDDLEENIVSGAYALPGSSEL